MILSADGVRRWFIDPRKAPWCHKGVSTVCVKVGSSYIEDDKNQYQHITTAMGYMSYYENPIDDTIIDISEGIYMWGDGP